MTSVESAIGWSDVERVIARLAETGERFDTVNSRSNRIAAYEADWRLQLETPAGLNWLELVHVRTCWETFERLGRIRRSDVLEPGRCSAFMMALFAQVPGVRIEGTDAETNLVLPG